MSQPPRAFEIPRRHFVSTLVAGFTLAAGPVSADAIVTDTNGLDAGEVTIPVADGKIPGYRARPAGKTHAPVILVVQEVFGVHEHIKDICRRFAKLGAYAVAPSLYARYGDPGKYGMDSLKALFDDIVSKVPDKDVLSDLDSAAAFAAGEGADTARLGVTGYCWGGRIVWLYAAHSARLKAATAFYGRLRGPLPANPLRPLYPLDLAGELKAPVLGFYGGLDRNIPVSDVEDMRVALARAGRRDCRMQVFMDAQHGFFADYRPSYNAKDAAEAWRQSGDWFRAHGVLQRM